MRRRRAVSLLVSLAVAAGALAATVLPGSAGASAPSQQFPPVDQPGVSQNEIRVGGVVSKTNPLGGDYASSFDGVKAYFNMVNSRRTGIYGRKLNLAAEHDDQVGEQPAGGAGPPVAGQRLCGPSGLVAVVHRRRRARAVGRPDVRLEHQRGVGLRAGPRPAEPVRREGLVPLLHVCERGSPPARQDNQEEEGRPAGLHGPAVGGLRQGRAERRSTSTRRRRSRSSTPASRSESPTSAVRCRR